VHQGLQYKLRWQPGLLLRWCHRSAESQVPRRLPARSTQRFVRRSWRFVPTDGGVPQERSAGSFLVSNIQVANIRHPPSIRHIPSVRRTSNSRRSSSIRRTASTRCISSIRDHRME